MLVGSALGGVGLALTACGDDAGPTGPGAPLAVHVVAPSATDARIDEWNAEHYAVVDTASIAPRGQLLVFLPGTGGVPANTRLFATAAARTGYHVTGLMYANDIAILSVCPSDPDPDCMARMRTEIITGENRSPWVSVDPANSIDNRLLRLLLHLAATHPSEGWGQYVIDGAVAWDKVAVSGLSQGGGHAAYIAMLRTVARVVMLAAPADGLGGQPGPWVRLGATPAERYFGLVHERDPFRSIPPNWLALGLGVFGPMTRVESSTPPFGNSHMLTTDLLPASGSYGHSHPSIVADQTTPRASDGTPRLDAVWRYLLGGGP